MPHYFWTKFLPNELLSTPFHEKQILNCQIWNSFFCENMRWATSCVYCSGIVKLCYVWRVHILKYRGRADRMHQCYTHKMAGFFTQNVMLSQMFFHIFFSMAKKWVYLPIFNKVFHSNYHFKCFFKVLFENLMGRILNVERGLEYCCRNTWYEYGLSYESHIFCGRAELWNTNSSLNINLNLAE